MRELSVKDLNILNVSSKGPMLSLYLSKDMSILDNKAMDERWKELLLKAEFYLLKDYTRSFVDTFMKPLWDKNYLNKLEASIRVLLFSIQWKALAENLDLFECNLLFLI